MTVSPTVAAAFEAWKEAELASYYASPCSNEVMTNLTNKAGDLFHALSLVPVASADDMLLKLFPILIRELEPRAGDPPLQPVQSQAYGYSADFYARLVADIGAVSPALKDAMAAPINPIYAEETAALR